MAITIREPTEPELSEKRSIIEALSRAVSFVLDGTEDPELITGKRGDLSMIGYLFYEGIDDRIASDIMSRGLKLLLGEMLVRDIDGCQWRIASEGEREAYCVCCPCPAGPVMIERVEEHYHPPLLDGETADLCEIVDFAYEEIRREYLRHRYGMWVPPQGEEG